jgi:hypothetical protein
MFDIKKLDETIGMNKRQLLKWVEENNLTVEFEKRHNWEFAYIGQEIDDGEDWEEVAELTIIDSGLVWYCEILD